jgi:hypothetical protein
MNPDTKNHPALGVIRASGPPGCRVWNTEPVPAEAFGYAPPIFLSTSGLEPTLEGLALKVSVAQADAVFRSQVARHLFEHYMDYERPAYAKQRGNPRYTSLLTERDLSEIRFRDGKL